MKIVLRLTFTDGTSKDITCNAADLVAFEGKFDVSVASIGTNSRVSHLLWLAWHSEFRNKSITLEFDAWLDTVENVGGSDEAPK